MHSFINNHAHRYFTELLLSKGLIFSAAMTSKSSDRHHRSASVKSKLGKIEQTSTELQEDGYVKVMIRKDALVELQKTMSNCNGAENENMTPDKLAAVYAILYNSGILTTTAV